MSIEVVSGGVALLRLTSARGSFARALLDDIAEVERHPSIVGVVVVMDVGAALSELIGGATIEAWLAVKTEKRAHAMASANREAVERLAALPKKTVALLDGPVLGTALEVALACDARVATLASETVLGCTEAQAGLLPVLSGLESLVTHAGVGAAIDLVLSGRRVPTREAEALGLVDAVVTKERAMEEAIERARGASSRHRARSKWRIVEKNLLFRSAILGQRRASLFRQTRGHDKAKARALDLIEVFVRQGKGASRALGLRFFSELCVSAHCARLLEVLLDEREAKAPVEDAALLLRLKSAWCREIELMLREGISLSSIDDACLAWGFAKKPSSTCEIKASASDPVPGKTSALVEEIQLRLVLTLILEVIRALAEGAVKSAREADLLVLRELGFPRFRGGPLRYADALGLDELRSRAESLEKRFGERFCAPALLIERAARGLRFFAA